MSTTHTPGPWKFRSTPISAVVTSESGVVVHTEDVDWEEVGSETVAANARLIAAAPELLAIARRIVAGNHTHTNFVALVEDARAVIAKAETP